MKLKTLKDIEKMPYAEINRLVGTKELRQSAIEWILKIKEDQVKLDRFRSHEMNPRKQGQITWIKHFFNITEEDLK